MMKRFILSIYLLFLVNIYSFAQSGRVYIKAEATAFYTSINDDNGSDEYRWNLGLNWGGMQCVSVSGGTGWHGRHLMLMNTTHTAAPGSFYLNVDFFEDAACGGWNCSYKGSSCGVLRKDAGRCQGDHGFNYLANEPGKTHVVNITDICGPGVWGVQLQYYYSPFSPAQPTIADGNTNKCGARTFQMKTRLQKWSQAKFIWQEETNLSGVWATIPEQIDSVLTITAPDFTAGSIQKRYRAYSVMNGVQSIDPSLVSQVITIYPSPPIIENADDYITLLDVQCNGEASGSVKVNKVDGIGNYFWSIAKIGGVGSPYNDNSYVTYPTFTNMPIGQYRMTVRNNNGSPVNCESYIDFLINEPPKLVIGSITSPVYNGYNVRCKGGSDGRIQIIPSGGVPPYSFMIDKGTYINANGNGVFDNLQAGTYHYIVSDQNNCTISGFTSLTEPSFAFVASISSAGSKCSDSNDGIVNFNSSGGIGAYNYSINNGANYSSNYVFTNLSPATYICIAKDANNCMVKDTVILSEPVKLIISIDSIRNVSCFNGNDGFLSVIGTGGNGTYKYSLNNNLFQNSSAFSSITANTYKVKIRDANSCVDSISIPITQPQQLDINFTIQQVQCAGFNNGIVHAKTLGGVSPYSYLWNGFADTDSILENLAPNNYFLTVKDFNNCVITESVAVTEPNGGLEAKIIMKKDARCNIVCNGEAEVVATGGTFPYNYLWDNVDSTQTPLIKGLCKGNYGVKIVDSRNCIARNSVVIEDSVQFQFIIPDSARLCPGQQLRLNAGNLGCNYEWFYEGLIQSKDQSYNLSKEGAYQLKVINFEGCFDNHSINVKTTMDLLDANFIFPSFVALGDTVVLVEVSQPVPDSLNWSFEGSPKIISSNPESPILYFDREGSYNVKLTAYLGDCIDSLSKKITFFIPPDDSASAGTPVLGVNKFKEIKLYPNPNDGNFKLEIAMDQPEAIDIKLYSSQGTMISNNSDSGNDNYLIEYNIPLEKGIYLLKVQSIHDYKTITFIVN